MSVTPNYVDLGGHSPSPHEGMIQNDDPALQNSNEHYQDHLHDIAIPCYGTTFEGTAIPNQNPQNHDLQKRRHSGMTKEPTTTMHPEQGTMNPIRSEEDPQTHIFSKFYQRYRIFFHLFLWIVFTGWWIAGLLLHGVHDSLSSNTGWLKPFLFWLAITLRIVFFHVPVTLVRKLIHWAWEKTGVRFAKLLPDRFKIPLAALLSTCFRSPYFLF